VAFLLGADELGEADGEGLGVLFFDVAGGVADGELAE
jgi:hypothetical protein